MKFGARKPSLKRSFKARTTSRLKRKIKAAFIPGYGKKGAGWIKNPKKAAYNKTSFNLFPLLFGTGKSSKKDSRYELEERAKDMSVHLDTEEWELLSYEEKNRRLFIKQKQLLDVLLTRHAISKYQYDEWLKYLSARAKEKALESISI
jgi:hypothetical protein